jgi:hypothetical protein
MKEATESWHWDFALKRLRMVVYNLLVYFVSILQGESGVTDQEIMLGVLEYHVDCLVL